MKRWQAGLLIASLVLNIFLAGAIAGGVWRWTHNEGRGGWRARAADALPDDRGEAFRQGLRATVRANADLAREARMARADAAGLFVQPQLDADAVRAQLARARQADIALRAKLEDQIVTFAATLPADQRRALAQALRAGPLRQPNGRRHALEIGNNR